MMRTQRSRAAAAANVPFVLSTASFVEMERVAKEADGSKWFQLYMSKEREGAERLITRARNAGFEALVVTTDVNVAETANTTGATASVFPSVSTSRT